ncbi:9-hexadecenoic acid cis-trans isomerase [Pseudoalteromonas citrea]|uniref:9-hexadecenoic acid cis-trans isomerase n=1 Tax=Pseudoalteromonas citrea TaxID=43655 RepID=A0A5S3XSP8_9GAMM|nr:fatty acid cis/trans isomerase [Pseudoalteromonas citrea]TMP45262.1 9-hexadecenoic acid cis-trans isomerase [Pseudoalteromonas citrea]TMP61272.1 9-hexadecenoic acid cis-trans isomerase [Pseudoalteromonas citrea]
MQRRLWTLLLAVVILSGCAAIGFSKYDDLFGKAQPQARISSNKQGLGAQYLTSVKPVLDTRCVVCHGCYDAPCQLKLTSPEGIDRGISTERVYDGTRLLAQKPSRLLYDAHDTQAWREKGFTPVLNERVQTEQANLMGSVLYNSLLLKMRNPMQQQGVLGSEYDFSLDRTQSCANMDEFATQAKRQPHGGMPYGLPAISPSEFNTLATWLRSGAKMAHIGPASDFEQKQVRQWEAFLNQTPLKYQLSARYIYEHWYLANIYFPSENTNRPVNFFKLVRSKTPPGQEIDLIATRRPYDEPNTSRVYYRLMHERSTILAKTHMPLALNGHKMRRLYEQFIAADYQVDILPSYQPKIASNPFKAFAQIPVKSKYQFMLDEAELIIKGYIKGPVCRGQVALNVINDHFWVAFVDPDKNSSAQVSELLLTHDDELALPASDQSNVLPISSWTKYAAHQHDYLKAKTALANKLLAQSNKLTLDLLWQGEGHNKNAALTVFRHFDSATVVKGFIGQQPKTMWVLDYALFERIHYLLVAGFDVYGNIGHQLNTRLYMDFLRLEGEQNFINLLPKQARKYVKQHWYRRSHISLSEFINRNALWGAQTGIEYVTDTPKDELMTKMEQYLAPILSKEYDYQAVPELFNVLNNLPSQAVNLLPQVSFILQQNKEGNGHSAYTLIHHNAHYNISSLLNETGQRAYHEDTATLVPGFIGDYPEAIWYLPNEAHAEQFVSRIQQISNEAQYADLKADFAIRRTHPQFWQYSDILHKVAKEYRGIEHGVFDYNRLENR